MEITVSKTALSDKLKSVGRIIQPKNSLPAYDNFLFVVDEFGVILVTAGEEGGRLQTLMVPQTSPITLLWLMPKHYLTD